MLRLVGLVFLVMVAVARAASAGPATEPAPRLALVVGNSGYGRGVLPTATNDAGLVAVGLAQAGFDVTALADADAGVMRKAFADFAAKVKAAGPEVAVAVYLVGYGLQYDGDNYIAPVEARIDRAEDVPAEAVRLDGLTSPLEALPARVRLFVFDLARRSPFAAHGLPLAGGLAMASAPIGTLYAFNAAPGSVAPPEAEPYGTYARAFAEAIQTPGLGLDLLLRRVRLRVVERTNGAVAPWEDGSTDPGFQLVPGPSIPVEPLPSPVGLAPLLAYWASVARDTLPGYVAFLDAYPQDAMTDRIRTMAAARREALSWMESVRLDTPRAFWTDQRRYPHGPHFADARRRLDGLHAPLQPPPRFDVVAFEGVPPPKADEVAILERPAPTFADADGPPIPPAPALLLPPRRAAFYEMLPPPSIPPVGTLPLPLPVAPQVEGGRSPGRIVSPMAQGGVLATEIGRDRNGPTLSTVVASSRAPVSGLAASADGSARTITQTTGAGIIVSKVVVSSAADGTLTLTQAGPTGATMTRAVSRNAPDGGRLTLIEDGPGRKIVGVTADRSGIVTIVAHGNAPMPRLVLARQLGPKGEPIVMPAGTVAPEPETPQPVARPASIGAEAAAPAMPAAVGLTGLAPKLNLPLPESAAAAPSASPTEPAASVAPKEDVRSGVPDAPKAAAVEPVAPVTVPPSEPATAEAPKPTIAEPSKPAAPKPPQAPVVPTPKAAAIQPQPEAAAVESPSKGAVEVSPPPAAGPTDARRNARRSLARPHTAVRAAVSSAAAARGIEDARRATARPAGSAGRDSIRIVEASPRPRCRATRRCRPCVPPRARRRDRRRVGHGVDHATSRKPQRPDPEA